MLRVTLMVQDELAKEGLRPGFNLCVRLCHGRYLNVLGKLLFYNLHVALCYTLRIPKIQLHQMES